MTHSGCEDLDRRPATPASRNSSASPQRDMSQPTRFGTIEAVPRSAATYRLHRLGLAPRAAMSPGAVMSRLPLQVAARRRELQVRW